MLLDKTGGSDGVTMRIQILSRPLCMTGLLVNRRDIRLHCGDERLLVSPTVQAPSC